jgi:diguanylate cyclase (GGDEF)-like protein/PAS domain S-box-containing protein
MNMAMNTADDGSRAAVRIVLYYAVFAGLWILLSDKAVAFLFNDPATITLVSMFKGWFFVAVTSLLLYGLIQRLLTQILSAYRHAMEAQLEKMQAKQLLDSIVNSSPDAIFAKDRAGRYLLFNSETARIFGQNAEHALGCDDTVLFPAQAAMIMENDRRVIAEDRINAYEESISTVDGQRTYLAIKGALRDGDGNIIGMFGISRDVTAQKQAEANLRIAATAFESQEGMVITDADGNILRVNTAFAAACGYAAEELIGKNPRILKSDRHDADFYREMWESLITVGAWRGEIWDKRKDGEIYPKWLAISAVRDDNGVVTHYIGTHYDVTERKKSEEKIRSLAFYDQLTGLPNRTLLMDRLRQAMTASTRSGSFGALLIIDLDNFKILNDTHGHDMGDQLLKQVAERLAGCVRAEDTLARIGGDEFVIVLTGLGGGALDTAAHAETAGEKIIQALNPSYLLSNIAWHSTPSIGITIFQGHQTTTDELMKQSDLAMYRAKAAGRNALRFFDPTMEVAVQERAALEDDLRRAIEERQFLLHYQAQVVDEGRATGAEVLLRWQHPQRGMVSPADFIPLAEETGLIIPLGQWVLETACIQLANWATRREMANLTIAVNVSARQFRLPNFVDQVLSVLKTTGANPHRLKLELTESLLVHDIEEVIEKMFVLKAKGIGFSLDDFGTGYSSLSYLKRFPLDQLKIDQSFVREVLSDPNDAAIAKTIVALGRSLGLGVIAEGVETAAQRDFLASSGCHAYQGYFFSRPLPIEGFEAFVQGVGRG